MWDPYGTTYNYEFTKAGDTVSLGLTMVLYSGSNVTNVRAWVRDQEAYIDGIPPEGMAMGIYFNVFCNFTFLEEDILTRNDPTIATVITYDDIDGISHTLNGEMTIKIDLRPTEYGLFFHFYDQNYTNVDPATFTFTADITNPFGNQVTVAENVTITGSGTYQVFIRDLPSGYSIIEGEHQWIAVPAGAVSESRLVSIQLQNDTSPPVVIDGDYMDLTLTHQKPGQPWRWL